VRFFRKGFRKDFRKGFRKDFRWESKKPCVRWFLVYVSGAFRYRKLRICWGWRSPRLKHFGINKGYLLINKG